MMSPEGEACPSDNCDLEHFCKQIFGRQLKQEEKLDPAKELTIIVEQISHNNTGQQYFYLLHSLQHCKMLLRRDTQFA